MSARQQSAGGRRVHLLTAKAKQAGDWHFVLKQPSAISGSLEETADGYHRWCCASFYPMNP